MSMETLEHETDEGLDEEPFSLAGEEIPPEDPTEQVEELVAQLRELEAEADLYQHPAWEHFASLVRDKEDAAMTAIRSTCQTLDEFTAMRAMANTCAWTLKQPSESAAAIAEINAKLSELQLQDEIEREEEPE